MSQAVRNVGAAPTTQEFKATLRLSEEPCPPHKLVAPRRKAAQKAAVSSASTGVDMHRASMGLVLAGLIVATTSGAHAQAVGDVRVDAQAAAATVAANPIVERLDLPAVLRGEGQGLSAEDVARRAVATAPQLEASRAALRRAQAGAAEAYLGFFPQVNVTARYTRLSPITQPSLTGGGVTPAQEAAARAAIAQVQDPFARGLFTENLNSQLALANFSFPVLLDNFTIGAEFQYPLSDVFLQVLPGYEAAERGVEASQSQIDSRASEVAQQAREAFYNYARARAARAVAANVVTMIEAQERVVDAAVRAGASAQIDLLRLRAQLESARVAVQRAEGGMQTAAEAVRMLMHEDGSADLAVGEDLTAPLADIRDSREQLLDMAILQRPEAESLRRLMRVQDRQIEIAENGRLPHLVLAGAFSFDNPSQRIFPQQQRFIDVWSLSAVLSWSPNALFVGEERARAARASRAESVQNLAALRDGLRIQVVQALENFRAARASLDAANAGVVAAEEGVRVRTEQYRAGAGLITELMAATSDLARAQLDLVTAAIDARIARSQLTRAVGADGPYDNVPTHREASSWPR